MTKSKAIAGTLVILGYSGIFGLFYFWSAPIDYLKQFTEQGVFFAPLILILIAFIEVILAPATVLPLLPPATLLFGPFWAGTYVLIGWVSGSAVAFLIARHFGRPILERFASLKKIEEYENRIPEQAHFWWIFLFRFAVQIDALSYAFGLFSKISVYKFTLATFLAFAPAAYVVAFAGEAFLKKEFLNVVLITLGFALLFAILIYLYQKRK
jgi:uncharacterized membrane protein YdjX (TVP38/TMEM64 family)